MCSTHSVESSLTNACNYASLIRLDEYSVSTLSSNKSVWRVNEWDHACIYALFFSGTRCAEQKVNCQNMRQVSLKSRLHKDMEISHLVQ